MSVGSGSQTGTRSATGSSALRRMDDGSRKALTEFHGACTSVKFQKASKYYTSATTHRASIQCICSSENMWTMCVIVLLKVALVDDAAEWRKPPFVVTIPTSPMAFVGNVICVLTTRKPND